MAQSPFQLEPGVTGYANRMHLGARASQVRSLGLEMEVGGTCTGLPGDSVLARS